MNHGDEKRFEDFFREAKYVAFKNHLYNYTVRKAAIESILVPQAPRLVLEVGSGISPVMTQTERIVYSELSPRALRTLKTLHGKGWYVAADSTRLPFRDGAFSHALSSEVFEHIENDQAAMTELARTVETGGALLVSVPHRMMYFANDDRFVNHFRRYETAELAAKLDAAGADVVRIRKLLGPLEKLTMMAACALVSRLQGFRRGEETSGAPSPFVTLLVPPFKWANRFYAALCRIDAFLWPRAFAAVVLAEARKR